MHYQIKGIYSPQANQNCLINTKVLLILLLVVLFLIASVAFLLFKANTFGELAYSYLISLTLVLCLGFILIHALNNPKNLQLMEKYDQFIHKSEFLFKQNHVVFNLSQFNGKIECFSKKNRITLTIDRATIEPGCCIQLRWNK